MSVCQNQWACFALALALTCLCCFSSWHILNIFQLNHQHFVRSVARPYRVFKRNSKNNGAEFYICPLPSPAPPPLSTVHFMAHASKLNFNFSHLISIIMSVPHVSWRQFLQNWIHAKIVKNKLLSTKSDAKTLFENSADRTFLGKSLFCCVCKSMSTNRENVVWEKCVYAHCSIMVVSLTQHNSKLTGDEAVCLCAVEISFTLIHRLKFSKISIAWWIENKHHDTRTLAHPDIRMTTLCVRSFEKFENARVQPTIAPMSLGEALPM